MAFTQITTTNSGFPAALNSFLTTSGWVSNVSPAPHNLTVTPSGSDTDGFVSLGSLGTGFGLGDVRLFQDTSGAQQARYSVCASSRHLFVHARSHAGLASTVADAAGVFPLDPYPGTPYAGQTSGVYVLMSGPNGALTAEARFRPSTSDTGVYLTDGGARRPVRLVTAAGYPVASGSTGSYPSDALMNAGGYSPIAYPYVVIDPRTGLALGQIRDLYFVYDNAYASIAGSVPLPVHAQVYTLHGVEYRAFYAAATSLSGAGMTVTRSPFGPINTVSTSAARPLILVRS